MIPGALLLVILVAVLAARRGVTTGLIMAAVAVLLLFLFSVVQHNGLNPEATLTLLAFTITCISIAVITGRLRNRLYEVKGVQQMVHAEVLDVDQRLSNVLESITDGFVTLDANWRMTYVNRRAQRILGRSRQHLIGRSALHVFPEGVNSRIHKELERARTEQEPVEFEAWYEPGQRWFEVRAFPADQDTLNVYFRDVTRRKEIQGSLTVQARLLDAVGQAVIAVDQDGVIFYCNRAAEELFGWPAHELVQHVTITQLQAPGEPDLPGLLRRARAARGWSGVINLRRQDGSVFPANASDSPIIDQDDAFVGIVRVAQDASARQAEQHAQRLLADAGSALAATLNFEHTLGMLVEFVVPELADCCIVDVTEPEAGERRVEIAWAPELATGTARLTGRIKRKEAAGARLLTNGEAVLISPVSDDVLRQITDSTIEFNRLRAAGVRAAIVAPMNVGGRELGTLSAIGIRRSYTQSDVVLIAELARRAAFAVDNAMLYETASMANQSKSDFLAVMSHELRTPLTTVMGYTDLLLAGVPAPLTPHSQTYVERIRSAAWHLLGLIEQILIYARLEVGRERVHVEKVSVTAALHDAAELIEPVALEKGLEFSLSVPPQDIVLETDATKLRQILLNLLSNAVKFTEAGRVELDARLADSCVQFVVHDTGVGIAPEHQQRVFESFWQVDQSATRKEGGAGIGLSVSRKLARLLGGDIAVRSSLDQGATFTLTLPLSGLTGRGAAG